MFSMVAVLFSISTSSAQGSILGRALVQAEASHHWCGFGAAWEELQCQLRTAVTCVELEGVWKRLQCEQRLAAECVEGLKPQEEALAG